MTISLCLISHMRSNRAVWLCNKLCHHLLGINWGMITCTCYLNCSFFSIIFRNLESGSKTDRYFLFKVTNLHGLPHSSHFASIFFIDSSSKPTYTAIKLSLAMLKAKDNVYCTTRCTHETSTIAH